MSSSIEILDIDLDRSKRLKTVDTPLTDGEVDTICRFIMDGITIRKACKMAEVDVSRFNRALINSQDLESKIMKAKSVAAFHLMDDAADLYDSDNDVFDSEKASNALVSHKNHNANLKMKQAAIFNKGLRETSKTEVSVTSDFADELIRASQRVKEE